MWQYYMDNYVDGKSTDWYDYVAEASTEVDAVWRDWQVGWPSLSLSSHDVVTSCCDHAITVVV